MRLHLPGTLGTCIRFNAHLKTVRPTCVCLMRDCSSCSIDATVGVGLGAEAPEEVEEPPRAASLPPRGVLPMMTVLS